MQGQDVFDGSPFVLTATPKIGQCWAGRSEVLKKINRLLRSLVNRPDSTLDLLWSNFGGGKSHALYHIVHLLSVEAPQFIPLFIEIPEQIRHFMDLYRRVVPAMPWARIAPFFVDSKTVGINADLQRAARVIVHGNSAEREVATEWLAGGHVHLRELRNYTGISARLENDVQATDVLSDIVKVLATNKIRLVLLLDEFQRLGVLQDRYRSAILSNLRSMFSRNPTHFSVVAAATTRIEKTALDLLPQELKTLMGMRPSISLPEMSEDEAYEFVVERFKCFRPAGYRGGATDPIGDDAVRATIAFVNNQTTARLIPRTLLQALSWIYDEADGSKGISRDETNRLLNELSWDSLDENSHA
jgi:hypothetical protein